MVSSCKGKIESFDQFVILLKNTVSQMVYKRTQFLLLSRLARCLTTATMLAAVPVTITTVVARRVLLRRNKTTTTPNKASAVFHAGSRVFCVPRWYFIRVYACLTVMTPVSRRYWYTSIFRKTKIWKISGSLKLWPLPPVSKQCR